MKTRRGCRQVRLVFHRNFRRPVKIRVETELPRLVDRIDPLLPAGVLFISGPRPATPGRPRLRIVRLETPVQPDWRVVGDQDPEYTHESEAASL